MLVLCKPNLFLYILVIQTKHYLLGVDHATYTQRAYFNQPCRVINIRRFNCLVLGWVSGMRTPAQDIFFGLLGALVWAVAFYVVVGQLHSWGFI